MKKCFYPILITLFVLSVLVMNTTTVSAAGIEMNCQGTIDSWVLSGYYKRGECHCFGGRPVCNKGSFSSSGYIPPSGRLSPSQQMAVGIVGSLFSSIFSGMFDDSTSSPSTDNSYQEQLRIQQEEQRKKEMQAAIDAWRDAQEKAAQDALKEQQKKREQGALLIDKMDGGITGGGGKLEPMWIARKPELKPIQLGGHKTSDLKPMERLLCTSYFSTRALEETKKGNREGAKFFSEQSDKVMIGAETDIECKFPQTPDVPIPQAKAVQQMDSKKFTVLMEGFNIKLKELQNVEANLNKVRQEKQTAEENLKKIDEKITEISNQVQSAQKPEEKAQADDLLQQALAARSDAENQVNTAKQNEQELLNKTKDMAKDIDSQLKSIQ
ncbi:MAG: hypothetical protein NTX75_02780 [Proteobacteria bacterium]|nr:hypothetical protein [Pseudomonadota bacterium]